MRFFNLPFVNTIGSAYVTFPYLCLYVCVYIYTLTYTHAYFACQFCRKAVTVDNPLTISSQPSTSKISTAAPSTVSDKKTSEKTGEKRKAKSALEEIIEVST